MEAAGAVSTSKPGGAYKPLEKGSKNTKKGHATAAAVWNVFAEHNGDGTKKAEDVTLADFDIEEAMDMFKHRLAQFMTFLQIHLYNGVKNYAPGSQCKYASGIINYWLRKFPKVTMLQVGNPNTGAKTHPDAQWYIDYLRDHKMQGRAAAIKQGEPIANDTESIRLKLVNAIGRELLRQNTRESITNRCVTSNQWHGTGRSIEAGYLSLSLLTYDQSEEAPVNKYPEPKTGKESNMPFYPNSHEVKNGHGSCWYHSLGSYLIVLGQSIKSSFKEDGVDYLFPDLTMMNENSIAGKVTKMIHGLVGKVEGVTASMTGHGFRAGAADEMAFNQHWHIVALIARGNWDFRGDCLVFGYLTLLWYLALGGKALAGYSDCRQHENEIRNYMKEKEEREKKNGPN